MSGRLRSVLRVAVVLGRRPIRLVDRAAAAYLSAAFRGDGARNASEGTPAAIIVRRPPQASRWASLIVGACQSVNWP
jgi:hypothetical protein